MTTITHYNFREHVLNKPDYYGASTSNDTLEQYLYDPHTNLVTTKLVTTNNMIIKMFDEVFTNAIDNINRDPKHPTTNIKVDLNNNSFRVFNNGSSIPITYLSKFNMYQPQLAFSYERTSGNYTSKSLTSNGTYGIGVKLVNVYSKKFEVDIVNNNTSYKQLFKNNMSVINEPVISTCKSHIEDHVQVSVTPDFKRLGIDSIDNDTIRVLSFRVLLSALNKNVNITLNNIHLPNLSFKDLVDMFIKTFNMDSNQVFIEDCNEIQIAYSLSTSNEGIQVSMVNNLLVPNGGVHVNNFYNILKQVLVPVLNSKTVVSTTRLKSLSFLLINQRVTNPKFDGNVKSKLINYDMNPLDTTLDSTLTNLCKRIVKSSDLTKILTNQLLTSINSSNKHNKVLIDKLRDANLVNTQPMKCTLFITEGDSATGMIKTAAFHNLGCDYYGYYTLRGKVLNVQKCTLTKAIANEVVNNLVTSLGLNYNQDYSNNLNGLRYGRVVCVKDADTDGSAIMLLVYNLFYTHFKSLIMNHDYFYEFITPQVQLIARVNDTLLEDIKRTQSCTTTVVKKNLIKFRFNNQPEYNKFMNSYRDKITIVEHPDYFKGLAAVSDEDSMYFWSKENYNKNLIKVNFDDDGDKYMKIGFANKYEKERKELVLSVTDNTYLVRDHINGNAISDYITLDYSLYCKEACQRDIPSLIDGLKPVQRKLLYSLLLRTNVRKDNSFHKVFQVAAEAANIAFYHHGSASIEEACCNMMQTFIGSNNMNLIEGKGSIGTRSMLGKDHGATRYIACRLNPVCNKIFLEDDNDLLQYSLVEEEQAEPIEYYPIVPIVLINGARGIACGYSTFIPKYSLEDCCKYIINRLQSNPVTDTGLVPSYNNFKGSIYKYNKGFITKGIQHYIDPNGKYKINKDSFWKVTKKYHSLHNELNYNYAYILISELPIDSNLETIKSTLIELVKTNKIVNYQNNSKEGTSVNEESIEIIIKIVNDGHLDINNPIEFISNTSKLPLTNMYLWFNDHLVKYNSVDAIMDAFIETRLQMYKRRKEVLIKRLNNELMILSNKSRFIKSILDNQYDVRHKSKEEIYKYLSENQYDTSNGSYEYLRSMPIRSFEVEVYNKLFNETTCKKNELDSLKITDIKNIWIRDLNNLLK